MMTTERRNRLDQFLVELTKDMELDDVIINLKVAGVLTDTLVDKIKSQATPQACRHELIRVLKTRGDSAFDNFFMALLHSQQFHLANLLRPHVKKGILDSIENAPRSLRTHQKQEYSAEDVKEPAGILHDLHVEMTDGISPNSPMWEYYERKKADIYPHFTSPKGMCLILNNKKFTRMPERTGTDVDRCNLENLFKQIGYIVLVENDLTSKEMIECVRNFVKDPRHEQCSSVVTCILSHGEHEQLLGVDDYPVQISFLLQQYNALNCPKLAGKPKVFFIQACRGEHRDMGFDHTDSRDTQPDMPFFNFFGCVEPNRQIQTRRSRHPVESDFLISYATPPHHVSWRNSIRGSWYVQSICEVFANHARDEPLVKMLIRVNNKVSEYETGDRRYKQMPDFHCRLRKELFFFPGVST